MTLRRIQVTDFRCLLSADVDFDEHFTLINGPNASGKTSLLEAIYVLGRGRSFRTPRLDTLIRTGSARFLIVGDVDDQVRRFSVGVEGSMGGIKAKMGGERVSSLADLAAAIPVQIIDPEVHRLIEEGPVRRRRFVDWGVFHVEQGFVEQWRRYQQTLKQRNAALKMKQSMLAVSAWDADLAKWGEGIHLSRQRYVESLGVAAGEIVQELLGMELSLRYRSGWAKELSLAEALRGSWLHDLDMGSTQVGPQRAEVSIRLNGTTVKDRISRGQQKLLAAALLIAQLTRFPRDGSSRPTLLLDDPAAELDSDRLLGLIREVSKQAVQLVVTTLNPEFTAFGAPGRRYSVGQHGVAAL